MTPADLAKAGTEHAHQVATFAWMALNFNRWPELRLAFAIPNGGERNKIVAAHLKAEGVRRHVPDIFLPVARAGRHGLFIELKKPGVNWVEEGQDKFIEALQQQGFGACVCVGWIEATQTIEKYLDWK